MRRFAALILLALALGACAEQDQEVNVPPLSAAPVQQCRFSEADRQRAQAAVASVAHSGAKDDEVLGVLAAGLVDGQWNAVVVRRMPKAQGVWEVLPVWLNDYNDAAVAMLVSPGDLILADLVWGDEAVEDVRLFQKGRFEVEAGCATTTTTTTTAMEAGR